ncbi:MAG: hypothetical protein KJP08_11085 [Gammaproteobacteria bacterium]|nr:hypothetical protein [Gammaproteobacteria bacterium]NNF48729.1 hypothetical protein [Woeseiaceae bacterium]MBT8095344.1 hypothetical protein [Gammaproteobacteria bacterium]MBT8104133.1 hypothetical protein [Gammaproteobacteria bacterium]NNK24148.1 hypothetical protein [Woeseiaceae bacterium]
MTIRLARFATAAGLAALLLLGACAATEEAEDASAFRDFIEVTELKSVQAIRTFGALDHEVLNDEYVVVTNRDQDYLLEYWGSCAKDPFTLRVKPDVRRDARKMYVGIDTFRGCRIKALYELSPDQVIELRNMGMAPGEKPRQTRGEPSVIGSVR